MNFQASLDYLYGLGHEVLAIKLGLRNTELLLESFGNPHRSYQCVQIAGTNGKGSTAVMLDSICRTAGVATGLYTSPHLVSITERIKISGQEISEEQFAEYATAVRAAAERLLASGKLEALPTFFEHVTAIALLAFRESGVQLAILETGLGGRLDSTTAAGANLVAITRVALDHQKQLGNTLEQIAFEKAAIIRPNVTAVTGAQSESVLKVIRDKSRQAGVEPIIDSIKTEIEGATRDGRFVVSFNGQRRYERVRLGLRGRHQIENAAVAVQLVESLATFGFVLVAEEIKRGLEAAQHEGRLELHGGNPALLFDGAHNPDAAKALRNHLETFTRAPRTLLFGAMNDKNLDEMAALLFPSATNLVLTTPDNPRAASLERLANIAADILPANKVVETRSAAEALRLAFELTPPEGVICVTGSLYLVGEAKGLFRENLISERVVG